MQVVYTNLASGSRFLDLDIAKAQPGQLRVDYESDDVVAALDLRLSESEYVYCCVARVNVPEHMQPKKCYKPGDRFNVSGVQVMLCQIGPEQVQLITIVGDVGNRYTDVQVATASTQVPASTISKLTRGAPWTFIGE